MKSKAGSKISDDTGRGNVQNDAALLNYEDVSREGGATLSRVMFFTLEDIYHMFVTEPEDGAHKSLEKMNYKLICMRSGLNKDNT